LIQPVYQDEFITLYHADCIELLSIMQANVCITDPPYNVSHEGTIKGLVKHKDPVSDKGKWDHDWNPETFIHSLNNIPVVCFTGHDLFGRLYDLFEAKYMLTNFAIWHKTNPQISFRKASYLYACEMIILGGKTILNFGEQGEMHNHFEGPICSGKERTEHPTQKPLWLMRRLVQIHSKPGQTILDPYCGTGTTLLAARELSRKAIGIEQDEKWIKVAIERLSSGQKMRML
jgi:site-specific DNA-methyltransferase (adenine-specific)